MTTNFFSSKKDLISKIVRFYIVWIIALIWNSLIVWFISDYLKLKFIYSIFFIFVFNISIIFFLQKQFTFINNEPLIKQFLKFVLLVVILLCIMYILVPVLNNYIWNFGFTSFVVMFFITILNFVIQKLFIFKN